MYASEPVPSVFVIGECSNVFSMEWGGGGTFQDRSPLPYYLRPYTFYYPFQSEEDIDKKEGSIFICHFPWKSSQFGVFRVSDFTYICLLQFVVSCSGIGGRF